MALLPGIGGDKDFSGRHYGDSSKSKYSIKQTINWIKANALIIKIVISALILLSGIIFGFLNYYK